MKKQMTVVSIQQVEDGYFYKIDKFENITKGVRLVDGGVLTGKIGCVYPACEDSYYINHNLGACVAIDYGDGFCFAEYEE